MRNPLYDVAIIGAGVCGAAIARALSVYKLNVILLEKERDVAFGVSKANSGIIHAGFHHPASTLKAKLEIQGNLLYDKLHYELGFPFKRVGILVIAFSEEEMKTVDKLYATGEENGVTNLELCSAQRIRMLEPNINPDVVGGLYAPGGGVVEPYRFVFALVECAYANGVELATEFAVVNIRKRDDIFEIISQNGKTVQAHYAINSAGLYADDISRLFGAELFTIIPRKDEEFLIDRDAATYPNHVLFPVPAKNSKGILVIPTVEGTTMIGPTAIESSCKEDLSTSTSNLESVLTQAKHLMPSISRRDIIASFAGMRPTLAHGDFYIDCSEKAPGLIQVAGIQSPGLTAAPAIAEYVKTLLKSAGCTLTEKKHFQSTMPRPVNMRGCTPEVMAKLLNIDGYTLGKRTVIVGSGDIGLIMARRLSWTGSTVADSG